MLLGAGLVCLGVLMAALADRVRRLRITRDGVRSLSVARDAEISQRTPARELPRPVYKPPSTPVDDLPGSSDVISALVGAGYKKALATQAARACTVREQTSPESWMAAALRRCAQGGAS